MFSNLNPIAHGKHDNLHLTMKIGRSKRNPIIYLKLVTFFTSGNTYIVHSNLHADYELLLDFEKIKEIIQNRLNKMDFSLILLSNKDFFNRNVSTEELLIKIK